MKKNNILNFDKRAPKSQKQATKEQIANTQDKVQVICETFNGLAHHYATGGGALITPDSSMHIDNFYRELMKLTAKLEQAEGNFYPEQEGMLMGMLPEETEEMWVNDTKH